MQVKRMLCGLPAGQLSLKEKSQTFFDNNGGFSMKKIFSTIILFLMFSFVFANDLTDYFPAEKGTVWIYTSSNGSITDTIIVMESNNSKEGDFRCVFGDQTPAGTYYIAYAEEDNKIISYAKINILGQTIQESRPFPLVLGQPGLSYNFNNGDDCRCSVETGSVKFENFSFLDCIIVIEKLYDSGALQITKKSYYAKNIGLVYVTLIGKDGLEKEFKKLKETSLIQ